MKKIDGWVTAPQGFLLPGLKPVLKLVAIMMWLLFTVQFRQLPVLYLLKTKCVRLLFSKQRSCTRGCGSGYYSQQRLCECLYR